MHFGYKLVLSYFIIVLLIKTRSTTTTEAQLSKINSPLETRECAMKPSEMATISDSRWQNCKERQIEPQRTDILQKQLNVPCKGVRRECVSDICVIREKLSQKT